MTIADGCIDVSCLMAVHVACQCHSQRAPDLSSKLIDVIKFEIGIESVDVIDNFLENLMMKE
jgi:hypothetical protein